ncbi:MAG: T9SS type A sorting domain-containing protein, partial [candidate division Zixibacteria bacterium]|nr:T9SS type A sorting domain-containing protein [candidate division Zixibacteria bacterium]
TELRYYIPERVKSSSVSLKIYNLLGQWIKTMVNERQTPGEHSVIWYGEDENGREVSSGIYFYRLEAGNFKLTRRMVLLK